MPMRNPNASSKEAPAPKPEETSEQEEYEEETVETSPEEPVGQPVS
jgi:hypothetical protein